MCLLNTDYDIPDSWGTPPMSIEKAKGIVDAVNLIAKTAFEEKELEKSMIDYQHKLKGLIFGITRNENAVEDILQNVYLKAWTKRLMFRGDCAYNTWLHRIAVNECLQYLIREKKKEALKDRLNYPISENDPYSYMKCLDIENAFDYTLSEEMKSIVISKMQGYSEKEISDMFGLSIGTVKSRYFRARKQLSTYIKETTC